MVHSLPNSGVLLFLAFIFPNVIQASVVDDIANAIDQPDEVLRQKAKFFLKLTQTLYEITPDDPNDPFDVPPEGVAVPEGYVWRDTYFGERDAGFEALTLIKPGPGGNTEYPEEVVIVLKGTKTARQEINPDTGLPVQFTAADNYVSSISTGAYSHVRNVAVTGHSFGGALANYAGLKYGLRAITFDAPRLNEDTFTDAREKNPAGEHLRIAFYSGRAFMGASWRDYRLSRGWTPVIFGVTEDEGGIRTLMLSQTREIFVPQIDDPNDGKETLYEAIEFVQQMESDAERKSEMMRQKMPKEEPEDSSDANRTAEEAAKPVYDLGLGEFVDPQVVDLVPNVANPELNRIADALILSSRRRTFAVADPVFSDSERYRRSARSTDLSSPGTSTYTTPVPDIGQELTTEGLLPTPVNNPAELKGQEDLNPIEGEPVVASAPTPAPVPDSPVAVVPEPDVVDMSAQVTPSGPSSVVIPPNPPLVDPPLPDPIRIREGAALQTSAKGGPVVRDAAVIIQSDTAAEVAFEVRDNLNPQNDQPTVRYAAPVSSFTTPSPAVQLQEATTVTATPLGRYVNGGFQPTPGAAPVDLSANDAVVIQRSTDGAFTRIVTPWPAADAENLSANATQSGEGLSPFEGYTGVIVEDLPRSGSGRFLVSSRANDNTLRTSDDLSLLLDVDWASGRVYGYDPSAPGADGIFDPDSTAVFIGEVNQTSRQIEGRFVGRPNDIDFGTSLVTSGPVALTLFGASEPSGVAGTYELQSIRDDEATAISVGFAATEAPKEKPLDPFVESGGTLNGYAAGLVADLLGPAQPQALDNGRNLRIQVSNDPDRPNAGGVDSVEYDAPALSSERFPTYPIERVVGGESHFGDKLSDTTYVNSSSFGVTLDDNPDEGRFPETGQGLTLGTDQAASEDFEHVSVGEWGTRLDNDLATFTGSRWVAGRLTEASAIPTSGSATYNGIVSGVEARRVGGYQGDQVDGTINLTANFAGSLAETSVGGRIALGATPRLPARSLNVSMGGNAGSGEIVGRVNGSGASGSIRGSFYGPGAEEAGGNIQYQYNAPTSDPTIPYLFSGIWAASRSGFFDDNDAIATSGPLDPTESEEAGATTLADFDAAPPSETEASLVETSPPAAESSAQVATSTEAARSAEEPVTVAATDEAVPPEDEPSNDPIPAPPDLVTVTTPADHAAYEYLSWGRWDEAPDQKSIRPRSSFITGRITPGNAVPVTGSAVYSGVVKGALAEAEAPIAALSGTASLTADFGKRTLTGTFNNLQRGNGTTWLSSAAVDAGWNAGGSAINGTLNSGTLRGSVNGEFYGPRAEEAGGGWSLGGGGTSAAGIWATRRGPITP